MAADHAPRGPPGCGSGRRLPRRNVVTRPSPPGIVGPDAAPWFAGDLADPWVAAIAEALPRGARRIPCAGNLPDTWPEGPGPRTLVLHRPYLTPPDADRLRGLRERGAMPPRVVLALGPHSRYHQWDRWAPLVDAVLPEATAPESVARHLAGAEGRPRADGPRPRVAVVGGDSALRSALAAACLEAGFPAEAFADWAEAPAGVLSLGIAPLLEDTWARTLARAARSRPVIALLGFADRATVALARSRGAAACLDLPCDLADLIHVIDRLARLRPDPRHSVPPAPMRFRLPGVDVADPRRPA